MKLDKRRTFFALIFAQKLYSAGSLRVCEKGKCINERDTATYLFEGGGYMHLYTHFLDYLERANFQTTRRFDALFAVNYRYNQVSKGSSSFRQAYYIVVLGLPVY